jgi:cytosine/adenosine deaminase-related metal-dependent hydrolase
LIRSGYLWCGDAAGTEIAGASVLAEDGVVTHIGTQDRDWPVADDVLDASECVVVPGLVNTHHHLYQTLTRAFTPALACDLFGWLKALYPVWEQLDEESAYLSAWVGLAELLLSGCTTTTDHLYVHPRGRTGLIEAEISAAAELGIRFHPTRGSMSLGTDDGGLPPMAVVQDEDEILADCQRLVERYHDPSQGSMLQIALAPCSPFSVTPQLMRRSAELAERLDVRLHTHLAETTNETAYCAEVFGVRPHELAGQLGWLSTRTWFAHAVWSDAAEIARLAATGTGVAHCPTSNMMIGAGLCPAVDMRRAGVIVGLGCDGSAAHDASDLWGEVRQALLLAHLRDGPAALTARGALEMATGGGAGCLGRTDIGSLEVGKCADMACYPLTGLSTAGAVLDPVEAIVRCAVRGAAHTVVNGQVLVRDGRLNNEDLDDRVARHRALARRWAERLRPAGPWL